MTATKPVLGQVLNKDSLAVEKVSGPVKAAVNLGIGWVYEDGANGWTNALTNGSISAKALYWNDKVRDNSAGAKGDVYGTFYGQNAKIVGKAEGAIVRDAIFMTSEVTAQSCAALTLRTDTLANNAADRAKRLGFYKGHALEVNDTKTSRTDAATTETDCVFIVARDA